MGFRSGAYARIWKIEKGKGNFYVADMSTSKKKKDGGYEKDWGCKFTMLIGSAAKAAEAGLPDRVRIGDCEVSNKYDAEKKVMYTNYAIYSFQDAEDNGGNAKPDQAQVKREDVVNVPEGADGDELPFV